MPKGINGLRNSVQPMTGNASIEAAMLALSPEEQALVAQGIDPFGGDAGGAGGMYGTSPAQLMLMLPLPRHRMHVPWNHSRKQS